MKIDEKSIRELMAGSGGGGYELRATGCGRVQNGCTTWCEKNCQYCETWCERTCQASGEVCPGCQGGCMDTCEYETQGCSSTCEKSCQSSCEKSCQSTCEKSSQCGRCEYNYQCGSCESYQCGSCESYSQCGSCESCQTSCQKSAQNSAPTVPSSITVPTSARVGESINIAWGSSTDSNLAGYILERKGGTGNYTEIYRGTARSFTDTIPTGVATVVYRVKAYDSQSAQSGYRESSAITVITNSIPVISGKDTDLGGKKEAFKIAFTIDDADTNDTLKILIKLNGAIIKTIDNAKRNTSYEASITAEKFKTLSYNTRNELEISATDGKATTYRRYNFTRINSSPVITVPKLDYGTQNSPFSIKFTITDAESDATTVRIMHGDKVLKTITAVTLGVEQTFTFTKLDFAQIPKGDQTIKIEATDANGGKSVKLVAFNKNINGCGYILKKETNAKASQIIVAPNAEVGDGATLKIYVANNANDSTVAWEDISGSPNLIYNFKNTSKTASKWAIGVKIEIVRNKPDASDSYLYGMGVNFR